ncbi:MAG: exodeoxyribonuclease VII small subunit [Bacteroidota bacterium]
MTTKKPSKTGKTPVDGQNFESSLKRLEAIVESLEAGEVPLDKAMELYEEGIRLSKFCGEKLLATELRLKKLSKDVNGQFELTDLES